MAGSPDLVTHRFTYFLFCDLGGHHGHFAEVTFRWSYPAQKCPKLCILHDGKVVFCEEMPKATKSADQGTGTGSGTNGHDDENTYELPVVSIAPRFA